MCKTMAIKIGEVRPYKIAVYNNAFMGIKPKPLRNDIKYNRHFAHKFNVIYPVTYLTSFKSRPGNRR